MIKDVTFTINILITLKLRLFIARASINYNFSNNELKIEFVRISTRMIIILLR